MASQPNFPVSLDTYNPCAASAPFDHDEAVAELYNELKEAVFYSITATQINDMAVIGVLEMLKDDMLQHIRDAKYADEAYDE